MPSARLWARRRRKICLTLSSASFALANECHWKSGVLAVIILIMNKKEIAETLRTEVWHMEAAIKKLQTRCDYLKSFVSALEAEISGPPGPPPKSILDGKF